MKEKTRSKILVALRNRGKAGITNAELSKIALRYGGYLGQLYKRGYKIKKESLGHGLNRYTLISEPEVETPNMESAYDLLLRRVDDEFFVDRDELRQIMNELGIVVRYKAGTFN